MIINLGVIKIIHRTSASYYDGDKKKEIIYPYETWRIYFKLGLINFYLNWLCNYKPRSWRYSIYIPWNYKYGEERFWSYEYLSYKLYGRSFGD